MLYRATEFIEAEEYGRLTPILVRNGREIPQELREALSKKEKNSKIVFVDIKPKRFIN